MSHVNVGDDTGSYWRWHSHIWKWERILFGDNSEKVLEITQDLERDDTLILEMTQVNLRVVTGLENFSSRQDLKRYCNIRYYYLHYWYTFVVDFKKAYHNLIWGPRKYSGLSNLSSNRGIFLKNLFSVLSSHLKHMLALVLIMTRINKAVQS